MVTARILIESGIAVDTRDLNGDTPLLLIKNLITELAASNSSSTTNTTADVDVCSSTSEICDLLKLLVVEHHASLDALDAKGRSLLTYAVEAGDRCLAITRLLINLGAKTFSDQLGKNTLHLCETSNLYLIGCSWLRLLLKLR